MDVAEILKNFPNSGSFVIRTLDKLPAFFSIFLDQVPNENIILVHRKVKNESLNDTAPCFDNTCYSPDVSQSYIGQPLECPFSPTHNISTESSGDPIEEFLKKEALEPITVAEARKCAALYSLKSNLQIPLWLYCDALDANQTFLMSFSKKDRWHSRSWAIFHSWAIEDRSIDKLVAQHIKLFNVSKNQTKLLVTSTYVPDSDIVNGALLKVTWTAPYFDIPFSLAKTKLLLTFKVGFEESKIKPIWDQLQLLQKFLDLTKIKQERVDLQHPELVKYLTNKFNESDQDPHLIEENLTALLKDSNHGVPYSHLSSSEAEKVKENSFLSVVEETISNQRPAMDFTDKIWNILKDCCSYHELQKYLETVFLQIRRGTLSPIIQRSNGTRLAHKIRSLIADSAYDFELTVNPLEYLIELGIEKLRNDFINIFSSMITHNGKLSMPSLPQFKNVKSSDLSWTETCSQWLAWLGRMYTSLEVLILTILKLNLRCPSTDSNFLSIFFQILELFTSSESQISSLPQLLNNISHTCELNVNTSSVVDIIKYRQFEEWKLTLTNEGEDSKYQTVFLCCDQNKFPSSISDPNVGHVTLNCTAVAPQSCFVCSSFHTVSNFF